MILCRGQCLGMIVEGGYMFLMDPDMMMLMMRMIMLMLMLVMMIMMMMMIIILVQCLLTWLILN